MNALELERIAARASLATPAKATGFRLVTDVEPCSRLENGSPSGVVVEPDGSKRAPRVQFGVCWIVDSRLTGSVIAWFDRQADAHRLLAVLRGEARTPRPRTQTSSPGDAPHPAIADPAGSESEIEASDHDLPDALLASPAAATPQRLQPDDDMGANSVVGAMPGTCASCGGPLPEAASTGRPRLTCSPACRQAYRRAAMSQNPGVEAMPASAPSAAGRTDLPLPAATSEAARQPTSATSIPARDERGGGQLGLPTGD